MSGLKFALVPAVFSALVWVLGACDLVYPEVVVINRTAEHVLLKNLSFNGCVWDTVLEYGDETIPGNCLTGTDRLHFKKFDFESEEPDWFNYQTISVKHVDYGDFYIFEITLDDMEQDFSAPDPYGH